MSIHLGKTLLGVGISLLGSFLNAVGFALQKKGQNDVIKKSMITGNDSLWNCCKSIWWIFGLIIYVSGSIANSAAMAWGPQSLLNSLGATTMAWNVMIASIFLNEALYRKDIIGTTFIIIGAILSVIFGPRSIDEHLTIVQLKDLYKRIPFIVYGSIFIIIFLAVLILLKVYLCKHPINPIQRKSVHYQSTPKDNLIMLAMIFLASFWGAWNVTFMKSFAVIIASSFSNHEDKSQNWKDFFTYFIILLVIIANFRLEWWRQSALKNFGALYVVPGYQVFILVTGSTIGAVYFEEFKTISPFNIFLFFLSITITLIGVMYLSFLKPKKWICGGDSVDFEMRQTLEDESKSDKNNNNNNIEMQNINPKNNINNNNNNNHELITNETHIHYELDTITNAINDDEITPPPI